MYWRTWGLCYEVKLRNHHQQTTHEREDLERCQRHTLELVVVPGRKGAVPRAHPAVYRSCLTLHQFGAIGDYHSLSLLPNFAGGVYCCFRPISSPDCKLVSEEVGRLPESVAFLKNIRAMKGAISDQLAIGRILLLSSLGIPDRVAPENEVLQEVGINPFTELLTNIASCYITEPSYVSHSRTSARS